MSIAVCARIAALFICLGLPLAAFSQAEPAAAAQEEPKYSRSGADTCLNCHDDQVVLAIFQTKHAVPSDGRSPFGHGQLQCEACHGPGGNHTGRVKRGEERPPMIRFGADKPTPVVEQNGMCLGCHQANVAFGWHGGPHDDNQVSCADCHDSHAARDPVLGTSTQPEVCFTCHQLQRTASFKPYAHPLQEGKMACTGCHSPHGPTTESQLNRQTLNETCFQCHAEKRGPFLWEHAPAAEDCSLCHDPHGSNHPAMLSRRAPMLCQSCHSQAGHPSFAFEADGRADISASRYVLGQSCLNCHSQVHGSNHPSGSRLMR